MLHDFRTGSNHDADLLDILSKRFDAQIPSTEAIDQANAILYLANDAAVSINSAVLEVDERSYI